MTLGTDRPYHWTMATHSEKALKTLELMDSAPEAWKQADVKFVKELCKVPGEVTCPDCLGGKVIARDEAGNIIRPPQTGDFPGKFGQSYDYYAWHEAHRAYQKLAESQGAPRGGRGNCQKCRCTNPRARLYGWSIGKVQGMVEQMMWVGYIQWPAGIKFQSRFQGGRHCALCNKFIYASDMVPAVGSRRSDGQALGMWVGADCAKKFLPGVWTYVSPEKGEDFTFAGQPE